MASRALCIGVNAYQHTATLIPLRGCVNDARDVGALLSMHGFAVKVVLDATGEEMHDEIESLLARCGEADKVVVMLSGHGAQFENDNYLFPVDFGEPKRGSGVIRDTARDALAVHGDIVTRLQKKNKHGLNVVITDMCRSTTRFRDQAATRAGSKGIIVKREDIPAGTLVAFACEQGHTSLDTGRNGLYTSVLLQHLARPIDITKIFRIVTTEVHKQQAGKADAMQPWFNANLLGGEEDIVLVQSASVASVAAPQLMPNPAGGGGGLHNSMGAAQSCSAGSGVSLTASPAFVMPLDARGWPDFGPKIWGSLAAWRAAHPAALVANVSLRTNLTDADFVFLRGIKALNMHGCRQFAITDAAFSNLRGIHTLNMSNCDQDTITDAAISNLRGIHTLYLNLNRTITDAAFVHLVGIHTLCMEDCSQKTITDKAFAYLAGIHTLNMAKCNQPTITNAALAHLAGIHKLYMIGCHPKIITAARERGFPVLL